MQQTSQTNFQTRNMMIGAAVLEPNQFEHVSAGTDPAYWSQGKQLVFQVTGEESGVESSHRFTGTLTVQLVGGTVNASTSDKLVDRSYKFQVIGEENGGAEQESSRLLKGTLTVQVDEKKVNVAPKGYVYLSGGAFPRR